MIGLAIALLAASRLVGQIEPIPQARGASGLGLALRRLGVTGRVLYVTAHPDDEHNGVLVRLSRGLGIRTGLLTLTRGDGGQNEIGPELFEALGVLRTEELLAIHRYDGVEQYFGRPYEFGYSFSVEETFEKWGKEATLGDVVKVVRTFRPDVMVTLSLEDPGGGQHHQAAARLAVEAFRAAADPARFPEQIQAGLRPWQARKIYQGGVGGSNDAAAGAKPVTVRTGTYDPLLGMSWQELGSIARGSHRTQGASPLRTEPNTGQGVYALVDSEPKVTGSETDILDGVDVTLPGLRRFVRGDESLLPSLSDDLASLAARMEAAQAAFDPRLPDKAAEPLVEALSEVRALEEKLGRAGGRPDLLDRLADQQAAVESALALAQGLELEALADDDQVVPGQAFKVTAKVANRGLHDVVAEEVTLQAPPGWTVRLGEGVTGEIEKGENEAADFAVTVASDARYSQPYWHRVPGSDRYALDVPADDTLPWSPPPLIATLRYRVGQATAHISQPVMWRYESPVGGEKQKVLQVVPALAVRLTPSTSVAPIGVARPKEFRATVSSNTKGTASARVHLVTPAGWKVDPPEVPLEFRYEGEERTARFFVTPPALSKVEQHEVRAVAVQQGREYAEGYQVIAYPHVQERHLFRPSTARLEVLDVRLGPGINLGYVMGAGDEVSEALHQLGAPVTFLSAEDLAYGDLSRFTTIVTGIRAYQTRPDLRSAQDRIMKYVQDGGHLVVQYNKFDFNQLSEPPRAGGFTGQRPTRSNSPFAPYPASVTSNRITDENAPVKVLVPSDPAFTTPNAIGAADWQGWVQERGTYFLEARDPRYTDLVAMTDPFPRNAGEKKGALVMARVGRGTWTYVGLGLFRQIAAGTPGAYRLLANLVSQPRGR